MKLIISLVFILFTTITVVKSQSLENFDDFLSYFKKSALPINTRNYMNRKRGDNNILPDKFNLKYICKNDSSKLYYYLELISDDTQEITFSGNRKFIIGAAEYYISNNLTFITYQRKRQDEGKRYYLASLDKNGWLNDSLLVLSTNSEGDFIDWICSKLEQNKVYIFHYSRIFTSEKKTKIIVYTYNVDQKTGKFILEKTDKFESNCSMDDFNGKKENCIKEDPFYKFPSSAEAVTE